jgi:hypothetical protein
LYPAGLPQWRLFIQGLIHVLPDAPEPSTCIVSGEFGQFELFG